MGRQRDEENRSEAAKKGKSRIASYESRKERKDAVAKAKEDPNLKIFTFWEKIGQDGSWEEKEYIIRIKEKGS